MLISCKFGAEILRIQLDVAPALTRRRGKSANYLRFNFDDSSDVTNELC